MRILCLLLAVTFSFAAYAKPSPEEVRRVIDYYYNGQNEGVLLADIKLCDAVYPEGDLKYECQNELDPAGVPVGEPVMVWMMFMVPTALEPQQVMLQLNHQGLTMGVEKASVATGIRYRVWRQVAFDRIGPWTVKLIHDDGQELSLLHELAVEVIPAPEEPVAIEPEPVEEGEK